MFSEQTDANPPTPALAKAGAAPGTTAGVELFFVPNALHFPRATQAIAPSVHRPGATQATAISVHFPRATHATASFYGRSRLPFASPQNSPNPPLQLPGATQAAADLSCSSNKSLRPWQCPFKEALISFCFRCLFLGNVPLLVVTWFSRWHVMLDSNAAT